MNLPVTLSVYIARQFLTAILVALGALMSIVILLDTVELIRRIAAKTDVSLGATLQMIFFKTPEMTLRILPFAVLVGGMIALIRLTRSSELVVARASGVSVWQFLRPAWLLALALGVFFVTVFNPIASAMLARFEKLEARYISGKPSLLAVSSSGLWLRDIEDTDITGRERILHAMRLSPDNMTLKQVIIFRFHDDSGFVGRIDAKTAQLKDGYWHLENVILSEPGKPPVVEPYHQIATNLTLEQIQDSFASPETMSFWELPGFIRLLEEAGFSALRHKLHWYVTLASPLMLMGMIFLGAAFSLRLPRRGRIATLAVAGIFTGFLIYFLSDLVYALGLSGSLPIALAAFTPAIVTLLAGIWLMIHLEHG
jgi:lipopolysaccharide export system permease protein